MNRAELQAAVIGYTHNTAIAPMFALFLAQAGQRIHFGEQNTRPLRIAAMLKTSTQAAGALPLDFLEADRVTIRGMQLDFVPTSQAGQTTGVAGFTVAGGLLALPGIGPAESAIVTYYARFPALVVDTDTNWLLTNAPGIYLAAVLIEAAKYMRDDGLLARAAGDFTSAMTALQDSDDEARFSGGGLALQPDGMSWPSTPVNPAGDGAQVDPSFDPADYFNDQLS